MMGEGARSKRIRVERLASAKGIVSEHVADPPLQRHCVRGCGCGPTLIFFQLVQEELRRPILLCVRHGSKPLNCLFHEMGHYPNYIN